MTASVIPIQGVSFGGIFNSMFITFNKLSFLFFSSIAGNFSFLISVIIGASAGGLLRT